MPCQISAKAKTKVNILLLTSTSSYILILCRAFNKISTIYDSCTWQVTVRFFNSFNIIWYIHNLYGTILISLNKRVIAIWVSASLKISFPLSLPLQVNLYMVFYSPWGFWGCQTFSWLLVTWIKDSVPD